MIKSIIALSLSLLSLNFAYASIADSTVSVRSAAESYQFVYNAKAGSVEVKQKLVAAYISSNFQANVPVAKTYNNHVTINAVACEVDGRTLRDFKPEYTYYGSDDIFYSD